MQFILTAFDGTGPGALERRMKTRPEHLEKIALVKQAGHYICGGAILNEEGIMIGSVIIYEVADRAELDRILLNEPYINDKIWEKIDIRPFRVAKIES